MAGPGGYPPNQQMYHQNMPRTLSGGQLMPPHSMILSTSHHPNYSGQPPPQLMASSTHMMSTSQHQSFIQNNASAQHMFTAQPRSPAVNQLAQALTPSGPPSVGGPPSNNPQTPVNPTPATPQQPPYSNDSLPPDAMSVSRSLILKDLRHALSEVARATADLVRPPSSRQQLDASVASHNPLSVNPQSVNPSSVKSLDEPRSVESCLLPPRETYNTAMNNMLAVCDQVEMHLMLVLEAQKQCTRFDKMFSGEFKVVGDTANANYSQYALGYVHSTARVHSAVQRSLHSLGALLERTRNVQHPSTDCTPLH